jgi:alanine racemase
VALRQAGIVAPVLVLSEQPPEQLDEIVRWHLAATAYTVPYLGALAEAVREASGPTIAVHVKVDTGMHRVGADPQEVPDLVRALLALPELQWAGLWTHLARADQPDERTTAVQLARLEAVEDELTAAGLVPPLVHVANSAGGLAWPAARRDVVRAGIAVYGIAPGPALRGACAELEPALSLKARIGHVRQVGAGEGISYGHATVTAAATTIATVPIGYADGVPRRLSGTGSALVHGRRCPIAGVVTMDQLMLDCGDLPVVAGDEVVLIGAQGGERITADDWADALGTIAYEIVCGISSRVPRVYRDDESEPA